MSVTTWTRIEPDTHRDSPALDLADGVAARLADPLWMLGRQWQMGEMTGEDAGSPVGVHVAATSFLVDTIFTPGGSIPYDVNATAVEADIERDGAPGDLRTRASAGFVLLDRLTEANFDPGNAERYRARVLEHHALTADARYVGAADGDTLFLSIEQGTFAEQLGVAEEDRAGFQALATAWADWYRPRGGRRSSKAFVSDRFEYNFALGVTVEEGRLSLDAGEHTGGRLDWDSFSTQAPAAGAPAVPKVTEVSTLPLLLEVPGMPGLWFWELEDPRFDTGRIEAGPSDTGRLLLIESALAYASDWFLIPLKLPVASMSRVTSLEVTDTFGVRTIIRPVEQVRPHPDWRLWRMSDGGANIPYLFLPPPAAGFLAGEPIEDVVLVRDEAANVAWALHQILPDRHGRPTRATPVPPQHATPGSTGSDLVYTAMSPLPDARVPLVLVEDQNGRFLVRARLAGDPEAPLDRVGELLPADFRLRDEEFIDDGLRLQRRFEIGRTPNGMLHLWASRAKQPGARLMASGLAFDTTESQQP